MKLRRFAEGTVFEVELDWNDLEDSVSLSECKKLFPNQPSYSFRNVSVWTTILERLQAGTARKSDVSDKGTKKQCVVPVTRLRRYYTSMKVFDKSLFEGIAKFYENNPSALVELWNDSRSVFEAYSNQEDWGRGETKPLPKPPNCLRDVLSTNEFTAFFKTPGKITSSLGLSFVEREINPWRTRGAVFPDKRPATKTGRGGIDLLLATLDGVPVIGEVKVKNDKNAFFALLQAMTYAVELSTPNQQARLKTHFPTAFSRLKREDPQVRVAIIMVHPVADATRDPVKSLITQMNKSGKCKGLGKVELFWNEDEQWVSHS